MACLDMYNNSLPPSAPPMSPRISFSNDFVESHNNNNNNNSHHLLASSRSEPPLASSDFEFSVSNYNMLSADELFFKGRLLPFKDNINNGVGGCGNSNNNSHMQRTLRDELLLGDDDQDDLDFSLKPPKSSSSSSSSNKWKGFLGLRKSHIGSKKPDKGDFSFDASKKFAFPLQDPNVFKSPQDMVSNEGPSSTDMEMGI